VPVVAGIHEFGVMSLIKCPECRNDISDQAASCPRCGYPLRGVTQTTAASADSSELDALVRRTLLEKGKIAAIKLYRERKSGIGLAEAKQYVDRLESATPAGQRPRSKSAGCLGLFVAVIVIGLLLVTWFRA